MAVEWERHWCSIVSAFAFILLWFYAKSLVEMAQRDNWRIENLYHAVFEFDVYCWISICHFCLCENDGK
jgi:hypothetical protein